MRVSVVNLSSSGNSENIFACNMTYGDTLATSVHEHILILIPRTRLSNIMQGSINVQPTPWYLIHVLCSVNPKKDGEEGQNCPPYHISLI